MRFSGGLVLLAALGGCASLPSARRPDRLVNLYDAFGRGVPGTTPDWGFSCLVDYRGKRILFDSGTNADLFARNVRALGIDLSTVDMAIGSHAHADHLSGFDYLLRVNPKVKIYLPADYAVGAPVPFSRAGPDPAAAAALPPEERYAGSDGSVASSGRYWGADVEYVKGHREIAPGVTLIATVSEILGYFSKYPPNERAPKLSGLPELSLSLRTDEGEVLVVGCSHSSVEVIVKATKDHLRRDIDLVMGGFHLVPYGAEEIARLARAMRDDHKVRRVAPAHCTGHLAFKAFRELYGERYLYAGLGTEIRLP
jgi:7,8-dihydropterin-6-yl-methyl-4-(beta-D-ribofuranosyl)aminobenzene 5'-phosphate synthase